MFKVYLSAISIVFICLSFTADKPVNDDCTCKEIPLFGRVRVVSSYADFKVEVVTAFEDIKIDTTKTITNKCGQWQIVNDFPDFTVQFVNAFPDFKVRFVTAFEGL